MIAWWWILIVFIVGFLSGIITVSVMAANAKTMGFETETERTNAGGDCKYLREINRELTKEEYELLQTLTYKEQHSWLFPDGVPQTWEAGYGYYGHKLEERRGHYFAVFSIGASCD